MILTVTSRLTNFGACHHESCPSSRRSARTGFTLVELLTVIALIIAIAALAVPNFSAMLREQRMSSAVNSLQVAIMRARTYAINTEIDHAIEFCADSDEDNYLRIEAESAYLESVPNLQEFLFVVDSTLAVPERWIMSFLARRDAWGSDGYRFYTGILNIKWTTTGWGNFRWQSEGESGGMSSLNKCVTYYDGRYETLTGASKSSIDFTGWLIPKYNEFRGPSRDESGNLPVVAGNLTGYLDVNDDSPYTPNSDQAVMHIQDNLVVDDYIYLPYDIHLVMPDSTENDDVRSKLINYDSPTNTLGNDALAHGWDMTFDVRFGKGGNLLQTQNPEFVLRRILNDEPEYVRLQLLRGTARLKKLD